MMIALYGPDGSGKSTIAGWLCDLFPQARVRRAHWRPEVLPSPGATSRGKVRHDITRPHGSALRGWFASLALTYYYWLDFLAGSAFRRMPAGTVTIAERYFDDLYIDSRRYRCRRLPLTVRFLARLLPAPDITIVLMGDADETARRKGEIEAAEVRLQQERINQLVAGRRNVLRLDTTAEQPAETRKRLAAFLMSVDDRLGILLRTN